MRRSDIQLVEGPIYALHVKEPKNRPLLVSFGAMAEEPLFSFRGVTDNLYDIQKVFIRDTALLYYQAGLPPVTNNILQTVTYLKNLITEMSPSRTVFIGQSVGGFAAILYGTYLNVDAVHAISALTDLSKPEYIFSKHVHAKMMETCSNEHFQLSKHMENLHYQTTINLHFDETYEFDKMHAVFIEKNENVIQHRYAFGEHNLAMELRSNGKLLEIIEQELYESKLGN